MLASPKVKSKNELQQPWIVFSTITDLEYVVIEMAVCRVLQNRNIPANIFERIYADLVSTEVDHINMNLELLAAKILEGNSVVIVFGPRSSVDNANELILKFFDRENIQCPHEVNISLPAGTSIEDLLLASDDSGIVIERYIEPHIKNHYEDISRI
jgi:hypothetical protein